MNQALSITAFDLYMRTRSIECMMPDEPGYHELYQMVCQLFELLRKMNDEEKQDYEKMIEMERFSAEELQWDYMNGEYPEDF